MSLTKLALLALGLAPLAFADAPTYTLVDNYSPDNFFSMFTFFTGWDPTNGFVQYVNQSVAQSTGLISTSKDSVYIGVDHTNITPYGRPSVRLTSTKAYNHGLIVLDLSHMPHGCGTWPAFWTVGPNWPSKFVIQTTSHLSLQSYFPSSPFVASHPTFHAIPAYVPSHFLPIPLSIPSHVPIP